MTDDAYRDVIVQIVETQTKDDDGHERDTDQLVAALTRLADFYAEAAELAPREFTDAWTTLAEFNCQAVTMIRSDDGSLMTSEEVEAAATAMGLLRAHVQEDYGLDLMASATPTIGPARPIPEDPPFDVPDGPVDDAEYERLITNVPELLGEDGPEHDMAQLSEHFTAAAAVAPWNVRPALAVMTAQMQDTLDRLRDPSLTDQPGRVTPEQFAAAGAILRWDNRTPNAT